VREQDGRNLHVIVDHINFLKSGRRVQNLLRIANFNLPVVYLEKRSFLLTSKKPIRSIYRRLLSK